VGEGRLELLPRPRTFLDWLGSAPPPPFSAELVALARQLGPARPPLALELPPGLVRLARPF
jgi:hypothetical protein